MEIFSLKFTQPSTIPNRQRINNGNPKENNTSTIKIVFLKNKLRNFLFNKKSANDKPNIKNTNSDIKRTFAIASEKYPLSGRKKLTAKSTKNTMLSDFSACQSENGLYKDASLFVIFKTFLNKYNIKSPKTPHNTTKKQGINFIITAIASDITISISACESWFEYISISASLYTPTEDERVSFNNSLLKFTDSLILNKRKMVYTPVITPVAKNSDNFKLYVIPKAIPLSVKGNHTVRELTRLFEKNKYIKSTKAHKTPTKA